MKYLGLLFLIFCSTSRASEQITFSGTFDPEWGMPENGQWGGGLDFTGYLELNGTPNTNGTVDLVLDIDRTAPSHGIQTVHYEAIGIPNQGTNTALDIVYTIFSESNGPEDFVHVGIDFEGIGLYDDQADDFWAVSRAKLILIDTWGGDFVGVWEDGTGFSSGGAAVVPEPSTLMLAFLGGFSLIRRRKNL